MFTGLVQDIGEIKSIEQGARGFTIGIASNLDLSKIALGASICCSGCCLTVTEKKDNLLFFEVSNETLECTNLGQRNIGSFINLETSLCVGDELGGHFVSGHVDTVTSVLDIIPEYGSHIITFKAPDHLKHLIASKGSITIDGVSLTVNETTEDDFKVNIIPHTWDKTTFRKLSKNSKVNLEVDLLARYMDRILKCEGKI